MQTTPTLSTESALPSTRQRRLQEERNFQFLFLLSFPIFLAMALGARVLPGAKGSDDQAGHRSGLFSEAVAAARATIAIALTD
jgi:hypothetical protein